MPAEMCDDTAFMDHIHAFLPGWDVSKISKDLLTYHFGLVSDFLSECWSHLRNQSRIRHLQNRVYYGGALWPRYQRRQQNGERAAQAPLPRPW